MNALSDRMRPSGSVAEKEWSLSADVALLRGLRREVQSHLADHGIPDDEIDIALLLVTEASANAMLHGTPAGLEGRIRVGVRLEADRLVCRVTCQGPTFDPRPASPEPDNPAESGRGLAIIAALTDELTVSATPDGTELRMARRLAVHPES